MLLEHDDSCDRLLQAFMETHQPAPGADYDTELQNEPDFAEPLKESTRYKEPRGTLVACLPKQTGPKSPRDRRQDEAAVE